MRSGSLPVPLSRSMLNRSKLALRFLLRGSGVEHTEGTGEVYVACDLKQRAAGTITAEVELVDALHHICGVQHAAGVCGGA